MFESDDFDQILSQFDFPDVSTEVEYTKKNVVTTCRSLEINQNTINDVSTTLKTQNGNEGQSETYNRNKVQSPTKSTENNEKCIEEVPPRNNGAGRIASIFSPKHTKRKIINSFFDPKSKRKFPGPAGLLTGNLEEAKDETICHMELLSQDMEFTQNSLRKDLFESPLWMRLLDDIKSWNLCEIDQIKAIKQQALAGNLRRRKAQTVTAFIETIDRSAIDPLIILRDTTGSIKCTLHRDAWSTFSPYIVSEYCALVLLKPTVLTTGSAFKKHYLNITLSNIYAIYSSAVIKDEKPLPDNYAKVFEDEFTVIMTEVSPQKCGSSLIASNDVSELEANHLLDDLDNIFSEDLF